LKEHSCFSNYVDNIEIPEGVFELDEKIGIEQQQRSTSSKKQTSNCSLSASRDFRRYFYPCLVQTKDVILYSVSKVKQPCLHCTHVFFHRKRVKLR
jgi:hypothetical protein